jgi:anionic cell wall polymer biosynthesis LytR-Cps2A-Psr (LCP) family protein
VCLAQPARDSYSGLDLPAGPQTVSGPTALAFVRQRHGLDGGDLDRIGRQQAFIAGLTRQLRASGALTDPARLDQLVGIVTRYVVIDRGWDVPQLVTQLRSLQLDRLTLHTIPTGRPDLETPVDGIAVQIDRLAVREFATTLMLTSSGTTKRLDRLEQAGLITRAPDPDDRRATLITLTEAGHELIDAVTEAHLENERELLRALTPGDRRRLADLLRKLQLGLPAP